MKKLIAVFAIAALLGFAYPASAAINSSLIKIKVDNAGTIYNYTSAKSSTGDNTAGGSNGGNGGASGDVEGSGGGNNNGGASTGNGGNGGGYNRDRNRY